MKLTKKRTSSKLMKELNPLIQKKVVKRLNHQMDQVMKFYLKLVSQLHH